MRLARALAVTLSFVCSSACSEKSETPAATASDTGPTGPRAVPRGNGAYESEGEHPAGHAIVPMTDATRSRTLVVQLWYPAAAGAKTAATAGTALEDLVDDATDKATLQKLVAGADPACTRKRVSSARDVEPFGSGPFPLVAFSHCHGCTRFAAAKIAERLASHGFVVIAPDHTGNTLFDAQRGTNAPLNGAFLATRAADIRFVLDVALDGTSTAMPASLRGKLDAGKVGVFGHSYGAATTGLVLATDTRPKAGLAIGAPMENDLLPPAKMVDIKVPVLFLLAKEDNSISEIGNNLMRSNFKRGNPPLWLLEIEDAGHWSFSDVCALTPALTPGCGAGARQTEPGIDFHYLENDGARALAASYVAAFFAAELRGDANAKAFLGAAHPSGVVTAQGR